MDLAGALTDFISRMDPHTSPPPTHTIQDASLCAQSYYSGACETFEQRNGTGVRRMLLYRTGLGEGQKVAATEYEIPAIQAGLAQACGDKQPELAVILTTQQTNTRRTHTHTHTWRERGRARERERERERDPHPSLCVCVCVCVCVFVFLCV